MWCLFNPFANLLQLIFMGREYPKGEQFFRERCHAAFLKNKDVSDPDEIKKLIARGEYVIKELEALYKLRKYRSMRKKYYGHETYEEILLKNFKEYEK